VYRPEPGDLSVTLDLQPAAEWVAEWAVLDADEVVDGRRRITLRTPSTEWAARLVLQLGGAATVVEPPEVRARVEDLAKTALAGYAEVPPTTKTLS
jgi:proteasome accessory factor C